TEPQSSGAAGAEENQKAANPESPEGAKAGAVGANGEAGEAAAELAEAAAVEADVAKDLADVAEEAGLGKPAAPAVEENTVPTVPVEVDPFAAATLDLNLIPQIREKINKLRETLESFGEVNWNALQMKREAEVRVQFLEEQFTDLETARDRLRDILTTINRKSRELFLNCFNDVRGRFNGMFRKLFGGGQAEIFLEQNVDVLEAGIEIVAKPPGKEPQHLTQLSGGEKTMTTIGLLMSIYQIKPSPFCIMDEIDADLDGPNVDRLNLTIKEFLDRSQFLIISHRPRTMTYADVLYGISMNMVGPEAGVSKRVSIAFEEIEEQYGKDDLAPAGEQPAAAQAAG
ncbi:MAG TPA: hypothetical protein VL860_15370, partial [Planctomycetota bacterium]|nr:hypothetical protein [Planctomycetota bacterium]